MNPSMGKHLYFPLIPVVAAIGCGLIFSKSNKKDTTLEDDKVKIKETNE